ncbi:hypothetical protein TVAG_135120 [Trichomonas vaginalis G3]|uniref:Uncharacterized protein n=1 Tax=Trichomonas vaginalis (strain ATCC PRA-98 / G3) TaxID=412133 RepID=A2FC96_TRIV3|nr:hypothetical protein TVAGG3_0801620 [Trichomonas vaginalis G3]EAX97459.1 hypothetical protein TVAG_135120 [Trichomonas vaginalis G3]KAI5496545.1 hypothetical protein TVAGG3_0801620 [Trichomonas vaginalis G3]|eukprot:XP_001310389.1 hypothetical protein [Trichomonas vaginalis G3]
MDKDDSLLVKEWLSEREFLRPLISDSNLPQYAWATDCSSLFKIIRSKLSIFKQTEKDYNQQIDAEMRKPIPTAYDAHIKYKYRVLKYLMILTCEYLKEANSIDEELFSKIYQEVKSFSRFCIVFPFILKRLISDEQTIEKALINYTMNVKYSRSHSITMQSSKLSKYVRTLNEAISLDHIPEIPKFSFSYTYQSCELSFEIFISTLPSKFKENIKSLEDIIISDINQINNSELPFIFDPNVDTKENVDFSELIVTVVDVLRTVMGITNTTKSSQKIYSLLIRYIFNDLIVNDNDPYKTRIMVGLPNTKLKIKDLPIQEFFKGYNPEMLITEFVQCQPTLVNAIEEIELTMFEISPIDILIRIDKAVKYVQKFISDDLKRRTGTVDSFIPFDNVIQIFNAVFDCAEMHGVASITYCIERFTVCSFLTNDLSFAYDSLIGVYSLRYL